MAVEWKSRRHERVIGIGLDQGVAQHSYDEVFKYRHCGSTCSEVVSFDFDLYMIPDQW
jgi:hypothetical protein